jgi:hypothetical protein
MRLHFRRLTCVLAVLLTIPMAMVKLAGQSGADAAQAKPTAVAKTWTVSRTSDGQPDLRLRFLRQRDRQLQFILARRAGLR